MIDINDYSTTHRLVDEQGEKEVSKFMDKHLFSNKELFSSFRRTSDASEQKNGADLYLSTTNGHLNESVVDEKAALSYANGDWQLPTFTLEILTYDKNGHDRDGWFIKDTNNTEYYMLYWLQRADIPLIERRFGNKVHMFGDKRYIREDNIREIDYCLVSRKRLLELLESEGWTIEKIKRQAEQIRKNGKPKINEFVGSVQFVLGVQKEKPINMKIKKETYFELSECHGTIIV